MPKNIARPAKTTTRRASYTTPPQPSQRPKPPGIEVNADRLRPTPRMNVPRRSTRTSGAASGGWSPSTPAARRRPARWGH
jgi:hypothetical protein